MFNDKYDTFYFGEDGEKLNITPYLHSLKYNERIHFIDKMITSTLDSVILGKYFVLDKDLDKSICGNLELYFCAICNKIALPYCKKYNSCDVSSRGLDTEVINYKVRREYADFAIRIMEMIHSIPEEYKKKVSFAKTQQKLLRHIAEVWSQDCCLDEATQYMKALIKAVVEVEDTSSAAIREATKKKISAPEKIIQGIELCRIAIKEEPNIKRKDQLNSFIQTLSISWVKSLKNPDEILMYIKAGNEKSK